jgi:hypothetical protein
MVVYVVFLYSFLVEPDTETCCHIIIMYVMPETKFPSNSSYEETKRHNAMQDVALYQTTSTYRHRDDKDYSVQFRWQHRNTCHKFLPRPAGRDRCNVGPVIFHPSSTRLPRL